MLSSGSGKIGLSEQLQIDQVDLNGWRVTQVAFNLYDRVENDTVDLWTSLDDLTANLGIPVVQMIKHTWRQVLCLSFASPVVFTARL